MSELLPEHMIDTTVCQRCEGSGEVGARGLSVNPSSGMLVPDPQMDETGPCPECHGTGSALTEGER